MGIADERLPHMARSYYSDDPDRENIDKLFPELSPRQVVPEDDFSSDDEEEHMDAAVTSSSSRRSQSQDPLSDAKAALQSMMKGTGGSGRSSSAQTESTTSAGSRATSPHWTLH